MSGPVSINPAPLVAVSGAAALAVIGLQYLIATPEEDALREFLVATALIVIVRGARCSA